MTVNPAFGMLRHEDCPEFEASLGCTVSLQTIWATAQGLVRERGWEGKEGEEGGKRKRERGRKELTIYVCWVYV